MRDLESTFSTLRDLGVVEFEHREFNHGEPVCVALTYKRGAFSSLPTDDTCGTFDGSTQIPIAFDARATSDLATIQAEFDRIKVPMRFLLIKPGPDGRVGADSRFSADGCVTYEYHPGWTRLPTQVPGKEASVGIDQDWYRIDTCP